MKSAHLHLFLINFILFLSSCELVGDIFKAGMWAGVIAVVLVIALVIWILKKIF